MSKLSKQHHAIVEIPDIDSVFKEEKNDPLNQLEEILLNCDYCYYNDCGICGIEPCSVIDEIRSIFDLIDKSCGLS